MKELELANIVLESVTNDNLSFKKALKNCLANDIKLKQYSGSISALVGCELRHHLLFEVLLKDIKCSKINYVKLALANHFFLKRFNDDEVKTFLKNEIGEEFSPEIEKLLDSKENVGDILPLDKASVEYISARFNTPIWLIKMWNKHFGKGLCFKTLKANACLPKVFVRENPMMEHSKALDDASQFEKFDIEKTYVFKGKSIRKNVDFQKGYFFQINPILKDVVDRYLPPIVNEFTIYSGNNDSVINELFVRTNGQKGLNLVVPDEMSRPEIFRNIRVNKIKNVNFFNANDPISLKTGISHPQEFIFFNPISSSFDLIKKYPDYLLHFKKEQLDEFIAKQKSMLKDLSDFVIPGGVIIYFVDTLNRKETYSVVSSFLVDNPEFSLVEERQAFPFEKENSTCYFAVLKRKEN